MKKIIALLSLLTLTTFLFGQTNDKKTIEINLKLLEKVNNIGIKEFALGVSIINHSDKNIYIPNFEQFASNGGVHFYQKEGNTWKEINIGTHDYYRSPVLKIVNGNTIDEGNEPLYYNDKNGLTELYKKNSYQLKQHQDSIIRGYYNSSPDHNGLLIFAIQDEKPLFLKAKQELKNYIVKSLDFLSTKKMRYKISFNTELRDTNSYYRDSLKYSRRSKSIEKLHYPKLIDGYQLFYPKDIISNVIYFTPTTIIKLKN